MPNIQPFEASNAFHRAQARIAESINSLKVEPPPHDNSIAIAMGGITAAIEAVNATMQSLDRTESDNVVALYAVGFGPHGGVSEHSETGHWISKAWASFNKNAKQPTICDIHALKVNPSRQFELALRQSSRESGDRFVSSLSDADISRFLSLAGDVCSKIGSAPAGALDSEPTSA